MIPGKFAQKRIKLRAKRDGTTITLKWVVPPTTAEDPTSGAHPVGEDDTAGVDKSLATKAFIHFIQPVKSGRRVFAEMEVGDAIVDLPFDLIQISGAGTTSLTVGQVVDEIAFSQANLAAVTPATGAVIEPSSLKSVSMVFGGHTWVQKELGEELAANYDTLYSGLNINRAFLMRKT